MSVVVTVASQATNARFTDRTPTLPALALAVLLGLPVSDVTWAAGLTQSSVMPG